MVDSDGDVVFVVFAVFVVVVFLVIIPVVVVVLGVIVARARFDHELAGDGARLTRRG